MRTFFAAKVLLWIGLSSSGWAADPTKPVLQIPIDQQTEYDGGVFTWKVSTDEDGDPVVYDFYLGTDPANVFLYQKGVYDGFEDSRILALLSEDELYVVMLNPLLSNTTYYWKVVARDNASAGIESDTWSFTTSNTNHYAPTKPGTPVPVANAISVSMFPKLMWQESTDGDGDEVFYHVYLDTLPNPSQLIASEIVANNFKVSNSLKGNKDYYWKVVADDGKGKQIDSDVWKFTTANNPPQGVNQLAPENNAIDTDYHLELSWQKAFDPDNDVAFYEVWYGHSQAPDHKVITRHTKTWLNVEADALYYWKVVTVDQHGGRTESQIWSFTTRTNAINHTPQAFLLQAPANNSTEMNFAQVLEWDASSDVDQDDVYYDVYAGTEPSALVLECSGLTNTTFLLKSLQPGGTYYWKVIAYDKHGGTVESDTWNFTTTSDDVGISALSVYNRYRDATHAYRFQNARMVPAFNLDSTRYQTKVRTTIAQAVAVALYYNNPSTTVSFDLPPSFTITQSITYNAGLPGDATSIYLIEGDFSTAPKIVLHLFAGQAKRSYTLNFFINELPSNPTDLTPVVGAEGISVHPTFTWTNGDDPDGSQMAYRLFMGTSPDKLTAGPAVVNTKTYTLTGNPLLRSVKYYWKIVAIDADGESSESDVNFFVTERSRTNIHSPVMEYPRAASNYMETDFEFAWRYDPAKNATYDLYFGISDPPSLVAQDLQDTRYLVQGLSHNTTYYWKVSARDQDGKATSSPVQKFRTKPQDGNQTGAITDTRDGQIYEWVKIGNQKWMVHNLAYEPDQKDGYDDYSYCFNTSSGGKEYFILGHDNAQLSKNGYLYNWVAAMNATGNPTPQLVKQGVCPSGWHIPTLEEWNKLYPFLVGVSNGHTFDQNTVHYETWPVSGKENDWLNHTGMSLLPSGYRIDSGPLITTNAGRIWLADVTGSAAMEVEYRYEHDSDRFRVFSRTDSRYGPAASVRCIENSNQPPLKPALKSPGNTSQSADFTVALEWLPSTDADGDLVQYTLILDNKPAPSQIISSDLTSPVYTVNGLAGNTTYYWKVSVRDSYGNESESDVWSFTTPSNTSNYAPAAPALVLPANEAAEVSLSPVLTWTAVNDPDGDPITYDVYGGNDANDLRPIAQDVATSTFSLNDLTSSTVFYWKVIAKDGNGGWTESASYSFTTLNNAPGKPGLLTPGNGISGALNQQELSWQKVVDPDGDNVTYTVYLGTSSSDLPIIRNELENPYLSYNVLQSNATYYWQVVATDGKGGSTASDVWSFKTYAYVSPNGTTLNNPLHEAAGVSLNPTLEWNRYPSDFYTYDLYIGVGTSAPVLVAHDLTTTSHTVSGLYGEVSLKPHTTYQWKVLMKNNLGTVNETDAWSFTTKNSMPSIPNLSLPINGDIDQPYSTTLQWQESTDADGDAVFYDVYLDTTPDPVQQVATGLARPSHTVPLFVLRPATTYYWKVVAKDRFGGTISSDVRQFTTQNNVQNSAPAAPALRLPLSYTANITSPVTLEWDTSVDIDNDAVVYDIYLGLTSELTVPIITDLSTLSYNVTTPLQPHSLYFWKVVARDNKGGETQSLVWNFLTPNAIPSAVNLVSPIQDEQLASAATTLTWHPATDADGDVLTYTVYLDKNPQPVTKIAEGLTSESYTTSVLENNTRYYWRVVAKDPFGGETSSAVYQFQSRNEDPSVPLLQSPASQAYVSSPVTTLSWTESNDPEGGEVRYEVFLDTEATPEKKMATVYNALAFATPSLTENTKYYWKVVARDNFGGINTSEVRNFTYQPSAVNLPPTIPILQAPEDRAPAVNRNVTLSWLASSDPEGGSITYAVYLSEEAGATTLITMGLPSTHYTLYNMGAGKRFFWRVAASDEAGNTSISTIWEFTTTSTYTISGTITNSQGSPIGGVMLEGFSNPVFTDASGYYEVEVPEGWTGSLVPVLAHHTFTPGQIDFSSVKSHVSSQDFKGMSAADYMIAGTIQDYRQVGLPNVQLAGFPTEVATDENGHYSVLVSAGWSGEIVPVLDSYSFIPAKRLYTNVADHQANQDFAGTYIGNYIISGTIQDQQQVALPNVQLSGFPSDVTTDENGNYAVFVPAGWSGEIIPVLASFSFTPEKHVYTDVRDNKADQDFVATYTGNYGISGLIEDQEGNPLEGVILQGFPETVMTNAAGQYHTAVPAGWGGEVIPVLAAHTFEPVQRIYLDVNKHHQQQDYVSIIINSIERNELLIPDIYPNPTTGIVRISMDKQLTERGWCVILGSDGREVVRIELQAGTSSLLWDARDRSGAKVGAGLYYCRIFSGRQSLAAGKIIVLAE